MEKENINHKAINAVKWSTITEFATKLITPFINILLARLLAPEAFGVVATATMVFSFADMLTDAGFQKYLVQHEFDSEGDKNRSANVAFWTNMSISVVLWVIITVLRDPIAVLVGNPGLGIVIVVACTSLPLTSFTSIQTALLRRNFDYKTLFMTRLANICVPLVVTIPLALLNCGYWSLIAGTLSGNLVNAIILTVKSKWKPSWFFNLQVLWQMLSFSLWSLVEAISIWLTSWVDIFVVGSYLNIYYLGLYKTSMSTINSLMMVITGALTSVLFSTLSRLQDDESSFRQTFLYFQRLVAMFVLPLGIGVFMYSGFVTQILLGQQWIEAGSFIGLWGLMSAITIVFAHFSSETYRSKGRPKLSFIAQVLHLVVLIPVLFISIRYGYEALTYARSLVRIEFIIVHLILMYLVIKISPLQMIRNVFPYCIGSVVICGGAFLLQKAGNGVVWNIVSIILCGAAYFLTLYLIPVSRRELKDVYKNFCKKGNQT